MEVRTIAVMAELAINVDTIEYKSSSIHGNSFELPFSISVDGSNYHGTIVLNKKYLFCYVYDVKSLTGNVSMMISKGKFISECSSSSDCALIPNAKQIRAKVGNENITFLKGSFTIKFEPIDEKLVKEGLINSFSLLNLDQLKGPNDVTLVVQEKEFEFNMSSLAKISSMFKDWFESCSSDDKKIPVTNDVTTVQTMETFQNILVKKSVEPQEITVDLYKFANFYDIQPLVKFCGVHLGSKINKENVLEIAMAADLVDHKGLLKKAAQFLMSNPGDYVKTFLKKNPGCSAKLFQSLYD